MTQDIFMVTSACMNDYGVYSAEQKFDQLLQTIQSIKNYSQQPTIVVVESSTKPLGTSLLCHLTSLQDIVYYQCAGDNRLFSQTPQDDPNQFFAKTFGEIVAFEKFFSFLQTNPQPYRRCFKISGRYQLNDDFATHDYNQHNIVIKKPQQWLRGPTKMSTSDNVYSTKLWSWHYNLSQQIYELMQNIFFTLHQHMRHHREVVVLEHLLYEAINKSALDCNEVDNVGIQGCFGQDGKFIQE